MLLTLLGLVYLGGVTVCVEEGGGGVLRCAGGRNWDKSLNAD